jgi:signal transduction histidine kinase
LAVAPDLSELKTTPRLVHVPDRSPFSHIALPLALLLCFATTAGLGLYALSYLRTVLIQERGDHLAKTAAAVASTLDRVLFERYSDIRLLASEQLIREGSAEKKQHRLLEYQRLYWYYSWLGLTDQDGHLIASTLPGAGLGPSALPAWRAPAQDGHIQLIEAHPSAESDGALAVGFAAPVQDNHGVFQGMVTGRVPLDQLKPILEQESRPRQGGEEPYDWLLLDRDGTAIVEKRPPAARNGARASMLRSSGLAKGDMDPAFIEEPDPRRQVDVLTGYARTTGYKDFRGFDWLVLIRMDRAHAYAPIDRLIWSAGWIGLLIITPLTGFGIWAYWKLAQGHHKSTIARQDLEKSVAELRRSNAELQEFAYVASHDLQEPLRTVSSCTQLLRTRYKGKLDADADDFIAFAVDGALRMQQLIHDLLAYSRVGMRAFEPTAISVEMALRHATDNLMLAMQETSAVVHHGGLPRVMADERQLIQLFQNLLSNAIKFRGKEPPRVHVSAERREREWVFAVRDNGIGLAPQYADRIFIIFQRLHNREEYPGTGIGLAICRKIVERHGGRIWVESESGQGSTFLFTLPDGNELNGRDEQSSAVEKPSRPPVERKQ